MSDVRNLLARKDEASTRESVTSIGEIVESSNDFTGWNYAPGWRAAARRTETHANGTSL
jgi:hypothetical protein